MLRPAIGLTSVVALAVVAGCTGATPSDDTVTASPSRVPSPSALPEPSAERSTQTEDAAPSTAAATTSTAQELSVTIGATGDLLAHESVIDSAAANAAGPGYDFSPMFAQVESLLSEPDVSLCHLETPLSRDNTALSKTGAFSFNAPYQLADAIAGAGWDGCEFASNHTMDRGMGGLADTESLLRAAGLGYAGPTADERRAGTPETYDVRGAVVAHLAYTYTYPNDGSPTTVVPSQAPWLVRNLWPVIGAEGILEDAAAAKADGADFVVVSIHWGQEYRSKPTEQQRSIAREVLSDGAVDLILGTQVHVVQPCEKIEGRYVFYGLGNFLSNQSPETTGGNLRTETQEGMVAQVTLTRTAGGQVSSTGRYQPTRVDLKGHVVRPVAPDTATYRRTVQTMQSLGAEACDAEPLT